MKQLSLYIIVLLVNIFSVSAAELELISPIGSAKVSLLQPEQAAFLQQANGASGEIAWKQLKGNAADLTSPRPVTFRWIRKGENQADSETAFVVQISETSSFQDVREQTVFGKQEASVYNLKTGTRYFWRVQYASSTGSPLFSEIAEFQTKRESPRWLRVPGLSNVRDTGGWIGIAGKRIRQGRIFRGSEMDAHMAMTPEGKRILLDELKIKTDLDLRSSHECGNRPNYYSPLGPEVDWLHVPLSSYSGVFDKSSQARYKQIFDALCDESRYPFYIHCWGGADRTGTLIFMIQAILGVSDADLIADYEATSLAVFGVRSRNSKLFQELREKLNGFGAPEEPLGTKARRFVLSCGVTSEQIEKIRSLLMVPE